MKFTGMDKNGMTKILEVPEKQKIFVKLKKDSIWHEGKLVIMDSTHFAFKNENDFKMGIDNVDEINSKPFRFGWFAPVLGTFAGFYGTIYLLTLNADGKINIDGTVNSVAEPAGGGIQGGLFVICVGTAIGGAAGLTAYLINNRLIHKNALKNINAIKIIYEVPSSSTNENDF